MTREEEIELLDNLERIRDETRENNVMLKQIIKFINTTIQHARKENEDDFGRNVLANMLSEFINPKTRK